jgi:hypothetical protein
MMYDLRCGTVRDDSGSNAGERVESPKHQDEARKQQSNAGELEGSR